MISLILDSFKVSIGAVALGDALRERLAAAFPGEEIVNFPCSDGGDGFAESVGHHFPAERVACTVCDPLGRPRTAHYLWSADDGLAIIESAEANGLALLRPDELNPMRTTTVGVGELLLDAARRGAQRIVIGVGGSATVDGGLGMAQALGFRFFGLRDDWIGWLCPLPLRGRELGPRMTGFEPIIAIEQPERHPLDGIELRVACDVMTKPYEAVRIYGPQKGATPEMVEVLARDFVWLDGALRMHLHRPFSGMKMGGAAGALAAGLVAFAHAELELGMRLFDQLVGMRRQIERSSLVITGEGKLDSQTGLGKAVGYVARCCRSVGVPVVALCGAAEPSDVDLDGVVALTESGLPPQDCIARPLEALDRVMPRLIERVRDAGGLQVDAPRTST
jgi:glycerate kinase